MEENEKRIEKAVALFKSGFNCAQSVVTAFADQLPRNRLCTWPLRLVAVSGVCV